MKENWISAKDAKPEIPEGDHAVSVIATLHDPVYEECNPGKGSHVAHVMWDGSYFKELAYGCDTWVWSPCSDIPTHWMYQPEPAPAPKIEDWSK